MKRNSLLHVCFNACVSVSELFARYSVSKSINYDARFLQRMQHENSEKSLLSALMQVTPKSGFISVILFALLMNVDQVWSQSAGFNNTFIILSLNGGANTYYDLNAATANTDFNNASLGTFAAGSSNLTLKGAEHNVYKCGGADLTSTRLYYRIYPTASPSGTYTAQNIGFTSGFNNGCGGQDQVWSNTGLTINLLTGLGTGNYTIEVYSDATITCCGGTAFASNSGNNYKATFTVSSIVWTNTAASTAWYTNTNWTPNTASNQWLAGSVAEFQNSGTATTAGINMATASLSIGQIDVTAARTRALTIGNSSTTVGTLTLNGVTAGSNANVILRNSSGSLFTLQNNETGTGKTMNIALGNATTNAIDAAGSGGITISSVISGASRSITKIGTGTLTLSGTNTYSGGTIISGGTVSAGAAANLGDAAGAITLGSGSTSATLAATGTFTRNALNVTTSSTAGVIDVATSQTLTIGALNTASGTDNTTKMGKSGAGTLTLSGAGSYVGQTQIGQGTVIVSNNSGLGTNNSTAARGIDLGLNVGDVSQANNVAVLATTGITVPQSIYVAPNTTSATRTIGTSGANASATFSNEVYLDGTATLAPVSGGTLTMSGNIINTGGLITTTGTTLLSGTNTFSGTTTVSSGTLRLGSTSALGSTAAATSITSGAVLDLNGINYSSAEALTVNGTGISSGGAVINGSATGATYAGLITLASASSIIGGSGTIAISNSGTITGSGFGLTLGGAQGGSIASIIGTGTGTLTKQDAGTWTLTGANTYSGATTISGGILRLGAAGVIADGSAITLGGGTLSSGASAGFTETMGTLALTANSTIALGTGNHTLTFANSSAVSWTAATTLTISGWTGSAGASGTAGKIFVGNTTGTLTAGQLAQISFSGYTAGAMLLGTGELVPLLAAPTVATTVAASSITNTTASTGGQTITGSSLTAKGVVYSTAAVSTTPTLANSVLTDGGTTTANFTSSLTGLSPQTQYYIRAYATNATGTGYGPAINFFTFSNPATAQASSLTATATAVGTLTLNWTGATFPSSGATQAGYALIYSTGTPTLSSANGAAPAAGVGTLVTITPTNLPTTPSTSYVLSGLTANTVYNILLVPFTWNGTNATTYNYLTASAPTLNATAVGNPSITTTTAVSSITNISAASGGSGISANGGTISAKGVVWNTSTTPTTANSSTNDGTGTTTFSSSISSLSAQTLYYVRSYATNNVSTAYGNEISFRTLSNPATAQATSLSGTPTASGTLSLNWTGATFPSSGATQGGYALIYSTGTPTLSSANGTAPAAGVGTLVTITPTNLPTAPATSYVLSGLTGGTSYNFLLVPFTWDGTNATTYNYLTTSAPTASATAVATASVTTTAASAITSSSASSGGSTINAGGGSISAKGVVWNTSTAPTTANSSTNNGTGTADFSSSLTSLSAQTLYYYRAYVTNEIGTVYGSESSFYTLSNEPTAAATSFTATANGSSQIDLAWTAATFPGAGASNNGYVILRRVDSTNPTTSGVVDGVNPASLSLPSGTTLVTTITSGATASYSHTSLLASTQYNYIIVPFTWDGSNAGTYNYYLTSAPTANATTAAGLPSVSVTTAASSITHNSASSGGSSLVEGGSAISAKGVAYNTTGTPTISDNTTNDGSGTADFNSSLTGLSSQTVYYVRAYVTNNAGTAYGNEINFRTLSSPATAQASALTATASASGELTISWTGATFPSSGATQGGYALIYSTATPTLASTNATAPAAGTGTLVTITPTNLPTAPATSYVLNGLIAGTTYNFLLVPFTWNGTNANTYNYLTASAPTTAGTAVSPASVTTTAVSSVTASTASSGGNSITAGGGTISAKGVVWNTATAPTTANNSTSDGTGTTSYSSSLTSLNPQTLYYTRAYVTNEIGTVYGNELTFRTLSNTATAQASSLSASPTANGTLTISWTGATFPGSGATQGGYALIYSTGTPTLSSANGSAPAAGVGTLVSITPTNLPSAPATSYVLSGLTGGTAYNFLVVPFTWDGVNATTYNYLTSSAPTASATAVATASVTTTAASSITNATASSGGSAINAGGGSVSAKGVVWNTATAPNTANNSTNDGTGTTTYTSSLSSLSAQTLYYARAYVTNEIGTEYGNEITFRTLSNPPTAQASGLSASASSASNINLSWNAATFPATGATSTGYVLLRATSPNTPSLGNGNGAAPTAGANTTIVSSTLTGTTTSNSGLTAATTYNYLLVPFTWDGTNATTYNYLTASAPTASATTLANTPTAQPTALVFSAVTASTITTSWTAAAGPPTGYIVLRSTGSAPDTDPAPGTAYSAGANLGNANVVYAGTASTTGAQTGLTDGTTYFYEVYSYNGGGTTINYLTTSPLSGSQATSTISAPVAAAASGATLNSFTANWSAVSGATGYSLDVSTNPCFATFGSSSTANEGFAGGTVAPSGWTFTAIGATYTTAGNFGAASPALTLDATGDRVLTNQLSGASASQLSFWIKGNGTNTLSALLVEGTTDGTNWVTIENITNSLPTTGTTKTYNFSSNPLLPCGMIQFRFTYTKNAGNLAFDDVSITSASSTPSFVSGYNGLSVSGTSSAVTGLSASTTYYYRLRTIGTNSTSANSNVISVATLNDPANADYRSVTTGNYTSASTWEYNSTGSTWVAATQAPTSASNVTIQAGHTVTLDANRSVDAGKTLTITGTLDAGANNISGAGVVAMAATSAIITSSATGLAGAIQVTTPASCTFTAGAKFQFSGTAVNTGFASFTGLSAFSFYNIAWTGTTSLTLDKSVRVTTLDFTNNGLIYLGNFDMSMSFSGVINGAPFSSSKMIVTDGTGSLIRFISAGTGIPFTWPIGEITGTAEYSPVTVSSITGNVATNASMGYRVTDAIASSNGLASNYVSRYWNITTSNLTAGSSWGNATYTYTAADIVGTEAAFKGNVYDVASGVWTEFASSSATSNVLTITSGPTTTTVLTGNIITARQDPALYYQSVTSGAWNSAATWQVDISSSFASPVAATTFPTATNSLGAYVRSGHTVTVSSNVSIDDLTIDGGATLDITSNSLTVANGASSTDATIDAGGVMLISSVGSNSLTIAAGAGLQVNGLLKQIGAGTTDISNSGTITVGSGATYEHARNAGSIPTCTWGSGSTCLITGTTINAPTGLGQAFHHFTVNSTLTSNVNCSGALQTINGKFKLTTNDASFGWRLTGTTGYTLNVADSLIITNGILDLASGGAIGTVNANGPIVINGATSQITKTGAATMTINSNSNLIQNAGIIEFNAGGSSNTTWNIKGDFVQGGTVQRTNGGVHTLNFNKASGTQTWTQSTAFGTGAIAINIGNSTTNTVQMLSNIALGASALSFNVNNGATLNMGPYVISGAASAFTLGATGALKIGNTAGITTAGNATGNVQTLTRTFPATASYFYNGTADQVTGNALPTTLTTTGNLNIEASPAIVVTLSANTTVPTLNLLSGLFAAGAGQNINISNNGVINDTGGDFVTGSNAGTVVALGAAAFNGTSNPYNVTTSGGINFGAQTVTIQNGGTFRINSGGFVNTNAPFYATGSTLQYWIGSASYGRGLEWSASSGRGYPHHVQISNNTTLDPASSGGAQANTPLRTAGDFTIDAGSAMYMDFGGNSMNEDLIIGGSLVLSGALSGSQASGSDIFVGGNWQNDGTSANFFPNNRAVFLNGTGAQSVSGTNASFPSFPYLFIDKSAGSVSLSRDVQVTELLNLTAANVANISTGANTLFVSKNTTTAIERLGSGHIIGNLRRGITTGSNTYNYPVGDATGYSPVSLALNNVTVAGSIIASVTAGDHPQIGSSSLDGSKSVNRFYTLTNNGVTLTDYNSTFTFVGADVDAAATTSNLLVGRYNVAWTYPSVGTRTSTTTQATSLSAFGDFALAECKTPNTYNVTGGGSICAGSAGVAVGLSGSDAWANYQLQRNGVNEGAVVSGTGSAFSFGNQTSSGTYTVVAVNPAVSGSCSAAMSGNAVVVSNPVVTPAITISASPSTQICVGTSVTFTAVPQFGGTAPAYQWKVNGTNVGNNTDTYTSASLADGDVVACVLTSNAECASSANATSNAITMTVNAFVTPSVTITSSGGTTVCGNAENTFTATPVNGGLQPSYQWQLNGVNVGSNQATYSNSALNSGDQVRCTLTSDYQCLNSATANSNIITLTVTPAPQIDGGIALTTCSTNPVSVSTAVASNTASISWTENGFGSITSGANSLTPTYTPAAGDVGNTVILTVTATGNSPCAAVSDEVIVTVSALTLFYADADGDGFGNPLSSPVAACTAPAGYVSNNTDCCDNNANINPLAEWWSDADGDGYGGFIYQTGCISGCNGSAQTLPYYSAAPVNNNQPYVLDCNDNNSAIYPGAVELCSNALDDDCDAVINEGCSPVTNDVYANATSLNANLANGYYPNCLTYSGTTINAFVSAEGNPANVGANGGKDVWYRFTSPSTAMRIRVVPSGFDAVLELRTAAHPNGQVDVENVNNTVGGAEVLNISGLTIGQQYYLAVRSFGNEMGTFTMCLSPLMPSGCSTVLPAGGLGLCSNYRAVYRGAQNYTFNFTGTGGQAATPFTTASISSSSGIITLSTASLNLRPLGIYNCRIDATYILQNGAGVTEAPITILGSTTSTNCSNIFISASPLLEVSSSQRCNAATLSRTTWLNARPQSGQTNACGATSYTYRFKRVANCNGDTLSPATTTFTVNSTSTYLNLASAFPSPTYPQATTGFWRVEVRPNYPWGSGTYGNPQVIAVTNTAASSGMDPQAGQEVIREGQESAPIIFPNPSFGGNFNIDGFAEGQVMIEIYGMTGNLVHSEIFVSDGPFVRRLEMQREFAQGSYVVRIAEPHGVSSYVWIVE